MEDLGPRSFPTAFAPYIRYLERALSPARYQHSLRVAKLLSDLVTVQDLPMQKQTVLAGLLHDVAKEMPIEDLVLHLDWYDKNAIEELAPTCRGHEMYLHGPAGALVADRSLGVHDSDVLSAIRQHTGCYLGMDPVTRLVHIADFVEPGRDIADREKVERLLFKKDLDQAEMIVTHWIIWHFPKLGIPVHPDYHRKFAAFPTFGSACL